MFFFFLNFSGSSFDRRQSTRIPNTSRMFISSCGRNDFSQSHCIHATQSDSERVCYDAKYKFTNWPRIAESVKAATMQRPRQPTEIENFHYFRRIQTVIWLELKTKQFKNKHIFDSQHIEVKPKKCDKFMQYSYI